MHPTPKLTAAADVASSLVGGADKVVNVFVLLLVLYLFAELVQSCLTTYEYPVVGNRLVSCFVPTLEAVTTKLFILPAVAPVPGVPKVEVGPYSIIKLPDVGVQFAFAVVELIKVAAEAIGAPQAIVVIDILNALQFGAGHVSIIRK